LVPLAKRGEPTEGGNYELWLHSWYNTNRSTKLHKKRQSFTLLKVPPAGRGNLKA